MPGSTATAAEAAATTKTTTTTTTSESHFAIVGSEPIQAAADSGPSTVADPLRQQQQQQQEPSGESGTVPTASNTGVVGAAQTDGGSQDDKVGSVIVVEKGMMSDHSAIQQQHPPPEQPPAVHVHAYPAPPPGHSQPGKELGAGNIVNGLTKVYEGMVQSSTPQDGAVHPPAPAPSYHYSPAPVVAAPAQPSYTYLAPPAPAAAAATAAVPGQNPPAPAYYATPAATATAAAVVQNSTTYYAQYTPVAGNPVIPPVPEYPHTTASAVSAATTAAAVAAAPAVPPVAAPAPPVQTDTQPAQDASAPTAAAAAPVPSTRSRSKRSLDKGSEKSNSKNRKKAANADGRWSKRFTWPEDLHRDFVSAIFDVGLKHSSPSAILEHMPSHEQITSERIKSHLQKYRLHRNKSKKEFMSSYKASLAKFQASGVGDDVKSLASGEVAAHLTHSSIGDGTANTSQPGSDGNNNTPGKSSNTSSAADATTSSQQGGTTTRQQQQSSTKSPETTKNTPPPGTLVLPQLTEDEKASHIGTSLGYLMGLFFSLRQQLLAQRAAKANGTASADPGLSYTSVVMAPPPPSSVRQGMPLESSHTTTAQWGSPIPVDATTATSSDAEPTKSSRIHLEQNNVMKRDMESQRSIQRKMRELKQQEFNKYRAVEGKDADHDDPTKMHPAGSITTHNKLLEHHPTTTGMQGAEQTGEASDSGNQGRSRAFSFGPNEVPGCFEATDIDDEELFDFLTYR